MFLKTYYASTSAGASASAAAAAAAFCENYRTIAGGGIALYQSQAGEKRVGAVVSSLAYRGE